MNRTDPLSISGTMLQSRLFIGTAGYPNQRILADAIAESGADVVTVSIRRISLDRRGSDTLSLLKDYRILPNTAGCETARDAILTAELAREALDTNWIKVEVIGDRETLYPDVTELLEATRQLVDAGFVVLPYCNDDPVVCQRLADLGAAAVMPMGSLIGSGMGVANPANLELICRRSGVPVIVDAGIGTASDATIAMELGASAVLLNTAVAKSDDPVTMARAMRCAVEAGRLAYLAGRMPRRARAEPVESATGPRWFVTGVPSPLLVVTDRHQAWPVDETVSAAVSAGARWVWLRDRDLEAEPRRQLALRLAAVMREARGVLTIGGDIELAAAVGCGAVHVRDVADVGRARRMLGRSAWIGMSAHSVADVGNASAAGADYVTLSPIYATASKPGYGPALGAGTVTLAAKAGIPVLALGGICVRTVSTMRDAGAAGVAVMGGIMRSENPTGVVKALLDKFRRPAAANIEPAGCPR